MRPVILSGGSGTRLWPLSRKHYPKQFLALASDKTMLQETLCRLHGLDGLQAPLAICNESHRFIVAEQLRDIEVSPAAIILEPMGKNTAPAIALAALSAESVDDILLVLPADHLIENIPQFHHVITQAQQLAEQDLLVTFGIVANTPEIGYGYIKRGQLLARSNGFKVAGFVEKPNLETATNYVDSGDYFWNSGMFAFKAGVFLEELEKFNPKILASCQQALAKAEKDMDFIRLDKTLFSHCPADSIDYAVMEKTDKAVVIPLDAAWNDVGSWTALWDIADKDASGNAVYGDVLAVDSTNSYLHSEGKLIAAVGVTDLVIVETDDAIMVATKDKVQQVKAVVEQLTRLKRREAIEHRKTYRPWGYYYSVDSGERYQTKRIVVNVGAKLSLQMHHHRAEQWVVVKGTALITKGDEQLLLSENESIYIPLGTIHCLENPGVIPLEIVEIQSGSYLGENDIIRFDDKYHRHLDEK